MTCRNYTDNRCHYLRVGGCLRWVGRNHATTGFRSAGEPHAPSASVIVPVPLVFGMSMTVVYVVDVVSVWHRHVTAQGTVLVIV